MADTGKQSPLGINVLGETLQNRGFNINRNAELHMGSSKSNSQYNFGIIVQNTLLRLLTWSIHDAYNRGLVTPAIYDKLIDISGTGDSRIPALGNAKPPTYIIRDDAGVWTDIASRDLGRQAPANTGYAIEGNTDHGQSASWLPYNTSNPNNSITQWGYIRLHALQAWNEFNFNGDPPTRAHPEYNEFLGSYMSAAAWVDSINEAILAVHNSEKFLENLYTDINGLVTGDVSGVSNSLPIFGRNLELLGDAIDLSMLSTFGLPSTLLKTLANNNAITEELSIALLSTGISQRLISNIISGTETATVEQERSIRGAFLLIRGQNLRDVLAALNTTRTFTSLADLLDVKKLFSINSAYRSLTVPVYNTNLSQPAKTYYPIYSGNNINSTLSNNSVKQTVGNLTSCGKPPTTDAPESSPNRYKELPIGFDSYLRDILPSDQAVAAGAFSYSMRQVKNIENMTLPEFANIVQNLELVNTQFGNLNLGTNLSPVDNSARIDAKTPLAQGSGPYNTYTMSDLFGSMSGLPYDWASILFSIGRLAPTGSRLYFIYQQLFLAVTWDPATFNVTQTNTWITTQEYQPPETTNNEENPDFQPDPEEPDFDDKPFYNPVTEEATYSPTRYSTSGQPRISSGRYSLGVTATRGGGYGRGAAPNPQVTRLLRDPSNSSACAGGTYTPGPNTTDILNPAGFGVEELMSVSVPASPRPTAGIDDSTARSLGQGTFGRLSWFIPGFTPQVWVTNVVQLNWEDKIGQDTLNNPETPPVGPPRNTAWVEGRMPLATFSVQHPPVADLPVGAQRPATNGVNTPGFIYSRRGTCQSGVTDAPTQPAGIVGWPNPMNNVVDKYISQANSEITSVYNSATGFRLSQRNSLIINWNQLGRGLTREQRTRYTALGKVDIPKDYFVNPYPVTQVTFVDSMPGYSLDTRPHMNAQTIENISNFSTVGGRSNVGMMRQERNQSRLDLIGIPLDNNIESRLTPTETKLLMANGTLPGTAFGVPGPGEFPDGEFSPPARPAPDNPNNPGVPIIVLPPFEFVPAGPVGNEPGLVLRDPTLSGPVDGTIPGTDLTPGLPWPGFPGPFTPVLPPDGGGFDPEDDTDVEIIPEPIIPEPIINPPDLVPPEQDNRFLAGILLPSVMTVQQAIDQVIECNCDCWLE